LSGTLVSVAGQERLERLLVAALDAEWAVQSARERPLAPSRFVREALELAMALTPHGIFGMGPELRGPAETPEALVGRLRGGLPLTGDPWTERMLERMRPLAAPTAPQLPPGPGLALVVRPAAELEQVEDAELDDPDDADELEQRGGLLSRVLRVFRGRDHEG